MSSMASSSLSPSPSRILASGWLFLPSVAVSCLLDLLPGCLELEIDPESHLQARERNTRRQVVEYVLTYLKNGWLAPADALKPSTACGTLTKELLQLLEHGTLVPGVDVHGLTRVATHSEHESMHPEAHRPRKRVRPRGRESSKHQRSPLASTPQRVTAPPSYATTTPCREVTWHADAVSSTGRDSTEPLIDEIYHIKLEDRNHSVEMLHEDEQPYPTENTFHSNALPLRTKRSMTIGGPIPPPTWPYNIAPADDPFAIDIIAKLASINIEPTKAIANSLVQELMQRLDRGTHNYHIHCGGPGYWIERCKRDERGENGPPSDFDRMWNFMQLRISLNMALKHPIATLDSVAIDHDVPVDILRHWDYRGRRVLYLASAGTIYFLILIAAAGLYHRVVVNEPENAFAACDHLSALGNILRRPRDNALGVIIRTIVIPKIVSLRDKPKLNFTLQIHTGLTSTSTLDSSRVLDVDRFLRSASEGSCNLPERDMLVWQHIITGPGRSPRVSPIYTPGPDAEGASDVKEEFVAHDGEDELGCGEVKMEGFEPEYFESAF